MSDKIKNVQYNNPSLIPIGKYDIDIRQNLDIEIPNKGSFGKDKEGNWEIIHKLNIDDKEIIYVDLVTLKKVLDLTGNYPTLKEDETAAITQLRFSNGVIEVIGDVVKVTKSK